ncbi:TetR family transcriptional regulator [Actinomadura madurae]|uniref:TetR/AcrR family transcriptional regulator n=1 Tax=Actinomadura madurae TaxID=1993 RepID=UPI0039996115
MADQHKERRGTPGRWRTGTQNRQRIVDAARTLFARNGYDRTTVRAIAAEAGVDQAMINYFFGGKQKLFAELMRLPGSPREAVAELLAQGLDGFGAAFLRNFLQVWDDTDNVEAFAALVRSASSQEADSAAQMREFVEGEITEQLVQALPGTDASLRASLFQTQILGLAMARYVMRVDAIVSASQDELVTRLGPHLQRLLTAPLDNPTTEDPTA